MIDGIPASEDATTLHGLQDSYNLSPEKTSAAINNLHRWVTILIYDLSIGRQKGFLGDNTAARALLSSGQPGGIVTHVDAAGVTVGEERIEAATVLWCTSV